MTKQKRVTIPEDEWSLAVKYFNTNRKELWKQGIKSTTALIRFWIRKNVESLI